MRVHQLHPCNRRRIDHDHRGGDRCSDCLPSTSECQADQGALRCPISTSDGSVGGNRVDHAFHQRSMHQQRRVGVEPTANPQHGAVRQLGAALQCSTWSSEHLHYDVIVGCRHTRSIVSRSRADQALQGHEHSPAQLSATRSRGPRTSTFFLSVDDLDASNEIDLQDLQNQDRIDDDLTKEADVETHHRASQRRRGLGNCQPQASARLWGVESR